MKPLFNLHARVEGWVSWELIHKSGIIVRKSRPHKNMVVDTGLDRLGAGGGLSAAIQYCGVGTDNTVPAANQTSLIAPIGTKVFTDPVGFPSTATWAAAYAYAIYTRTRLFDFDNANGNLTEVGWFNDSNVMFNRQLFVNDVGVPTAITKTSDYQLRVTLEVRTYYDLSAGVVNTTFTGDVTGATVFTMTSKLIRLDQIPDTFWHWVLGTGVSAKAYSTDVMPNVGEDPAGTPYPSSALSWLAYVNGNFYRDFEATWGASYGNIAGGIGSILWASIGAAASAPVVVTTFSPKVDKTDVRQFKPKIRLSWARH